MQLAEEETAVPVPSAPVITSGLKRSPRKRDSGLQALLSPRGSEFPFPMKPSETPSYWVRVRCGAQGGGEEKAFISSFKPCRWVERKTWKNHGTPRWLASRAWVHAWVIKMRTVLSFSFHFFCWMGVLHYRAMDWDLKDVEGMNL